jgi:hypothetical protein
VAEFAETLLSRGGLVGLCVPLYVPGRFKRAVVMDTALPLGLPINEGFLKWKECATKEMEGNFIPSKGMRFMMKSSLDTMDQLGVSEGYDAPYPSWEYTAGLLISCFPPSQFTTNTMNSIRRDQVPVYGPAE